MPSREDEEREAPESRRAFFAQMSAGGLALAATACATRVSAPAPTPASAPTPAASPTPPAAATDASARPGRSAPPIPIPPAKNDGPWDMSWLDRVSKAQFKLVFDIAAYLNGGGLYYAKNYLNGMRDGWEFEAPHVMPILGVSGDAYPIVFNDLMWEKYKYGESSKTKDARTGLTAIRNVWWQPRPTELMAEFGVDVLQARGAQFLFCNNVFRGVIRSAMASTGRPYDDVRGELKANLLPGVIVVPAIVAAMAMAQSRGAGYVFAGV